MNKRRIIFGSLLLSASLLTSTVQAEPLKVIRIGVATVGVGGKPVAGGTAFNTAQIKGSIDNEFKKDGIAVEWSFFKGAGPAVNEALANKQLDFAWQGDLPAIVARAGGIKTKLILATDNVSPLYLAVPVNSTAKSIDDLKGKKVAIFKGTNLQLVEIKVYEKLGLTEKDFKTINMDRATTETALATRDIDGGWFGPEVFPLVAKGVARIIYTTKGKDANLIRATHVLVTNEFEAAHPDIVQRLVNVVLKESAWSADEKNREASLRYWAQSGIPYDAFKQDFDGQLFKERLSPLIDDYFIGHYKEAAAASRKYRLIRKDIDVDSWFETKYLKQGLKDLQLEGFWQARDVNGKPVKA
jgi:ABC-type nitrate/sulfonate/bicarbonate transport systems, periplasmic components